ncbi:putative cytidylyltransferase [Penicillium brasilianum]|uniref:Putative cytidylyltransferase n=1 Tax=Penicillium brasilianum TaxID=104259 RepID=A0A1S9R9L3_PENBI|nr:putative cytidylyltransferase [Penicillium brasilianum]
MASFRALRSQYASLLKQFIASAKEFEVLATVPSDHAPPPKILYVLDSSFNPPTCAHLRIASSALLEQQEPGSRLLLLLAIQNADKPSKPAPFEDRLAMMELFAHDIRSHIAARQSSKSVSSKEHIPTIDIAVTNKPYFIDKAAAIEASDHYPSPMEQYHLVGYDTLIRIFNPKYYPPEHTLQPLRPLFSQHRLRVTLRPGNDWGDREEQEEFLASLARGDREAEGAPREWAQKIQFIEGRKPEDPPVSSTRAREAAQSAPQDLEWLVPDNVRQFVLSERPYSKDSPSTRI